MGDVLRLDYINSLPQPFTAEFIGDAPGKWIWPVEDIDVETGLLRIDVCGKLQVKHIGDVRHFADDTGALHDPDTFYTDYQGQSAIPQTIFPDQQDRSRAAGNTLGAGELELEPNGKCSTRNEADRESSSGRQVGGCDAVLPSSMQRGERDVRGEGRNQGVDCYGGGFNASAASFATREKSHG